MASLGAADAAENVAVMIRVRPLTSAEREGGERRVVKCNAAYNEITLTTGADKTVVAGPAAGATKTFTFDRVFDVDTRQSTLFDTAVAPVVDQVLQGFSCTVFAYGQTGTGKTFTMEGAKDAEGALDVDGDNAGIIVRTVKRVFNHLSTLGGEAIVKCSFLEIYNERLDDLLAKEEPAFAIYSGDRVARAGMTRERNLYGAGVSAPEKADKTLAGTERLHIVESKGQGIRVQNLEEVIVKSPEEVFGLVQKGIAKRATAETLCNAASSRSHCVFTLTALMKEISLEGEEVVKTGKINLVDLAGSECIGRSGAKDARAREAGNINQSLLTLGRVITALVDRHPHIPYRDSKLTRLLQDSLGGNTKTVMIATLAPTHSNTEETLSTLEYANRAKHIKNRPEANQKLSRRLVLDGYSAEVERLRARLEAQIKKDGGLMSVSKEEWDAMEARLADAEEQLNDLENAKAAAEEEAATLRRDLADSRATVADLQGYNALLTAKLAAATGELTTARSALASERLEHGATAAVVASRSATLGALQAQAASTKDSLVAAVADVDALHAKVGRLTAVMLSNRAAEASHEAGAHTRLGALASRAGDWAAVHSSHLQALSTLCASFNSARKTETTELLGRLEALKASVTSYANEEAAAAAAAAAATTAAADAAAAAMQARATAWAADAAALASAVEAGVAEVAAGVDASAAAAEAWAAKVAAQLGEAAAHAETFATTHCETLANLEKTTLKPALAAVDAKLGACAAGLGAMETAHAQATHRAGAELITAVTSLVERFMADRSTELRAAVASMVALHDEARDSVEGAEAAVGAGLAGAAASAKAWATEHRAALAATTEASSAACSSLRETTLPSIREAGSRLNAGAAAATTSASSSYAAAAAEMEAAMGALRSAAGEGAATRMQASAAAVAATSSSVAGVAEGVSSSAAKAASFTGAVDLRATQLASAGVDLHRDVAAWTAAEHATLRAFVGSQLRDDARTGTTPAKAKLLGGGAGEEAGSSAGYTVPAAWVQPEDEELVRTRYRNLAEAAMPPAPAPAPAPAMADDEEGAYSGGSSSGLRDADARLSSSSTSSNLPLLRRDSTGGYEIPSSFPEYEAPPPAPLPSPSAAVAVQVTAALQPVPLQHSAAAAAPDPGAYYTATSSAPRAVPPPSFAASEGPVPWSVPPQLAAAMAAQAQSLNAQAAALASPVPVASRSATNFASSAMEDSEPAMAATDEAEGVSQGEGEQAEDEDDEVMLSSQANSGSSMHLATSSAPSARKRVNTGGEGVVGGRGRTPGPGAAASRVGSPTPATSATPRGRTPGPSSTATRGRAPSVTAPSDENGLVVDAAAEATAEADAAAAVPASQVAMASSQTQQRAGSAGRTATVTSTMRPAMVVRRPAGPSATLAGGAGAAAPAAKAKPAVTGAAGPARPVLGASSAGNAAAGVGGATGGKAGAAAAPSSRSAGALNTGRR